MYSLLALLTLIVAASFVHAFVRHRRRYLPVFSVSLALSLYTHNWALFLALMCGVAYLVCLRRSEDRRSLLRDGLIGFGFAVLLYAPWLPTLAYQARHTGAPWDLPPVIWSLSQGAYSLVGGRGAGVALLLAGGSGLLALWRSERTRSGLELTIVSLLILGVGTMLLAWLYSKLTPAWADRYLAVVVGPLLLLFGVGLSRARWLGVAALALVAVFWLLAPIPPARYSKSNVQPLAAHVHRQVNARTLVLSTQPEQVPVISYYLPHAQRFGTPMSGFVPDPHVVDWRDALSHLRHGSVNGTLMPMLDTVAPGDTVLLVTPANIAKAPLWMKLIRHDSAAWLAAIEHSRQFKLIKLTQAGAGGAGVSLRAAVFVRR